MGDQLDSEVVAPGVELLESMRALGYSLESAIADLIDNSIAAGAHDVSIDADVVDGHFLAILDDGSGMSPSRAREALRLAGATGDRSGSDLGRFGLGLKTASLSQARSLTVVTRRDGTTTGLRWDMDHVRHTNSWSLLVLGESQLLNLPLWNRLDQMPHGTLVVWEKLDLLLGDAADRGAFLASRLASLRGSLGLVFHRYIRGGADRFGISINGLPVRPLDPFLSSNPRTQISPAEVLKVGNESVQVVAYTLPHASGLSAEERRRPDLGEGMRDAQGFYVYRKRRLISWGGWYGLARMSELSKQTRIQVDIPNTLDGLWQLDVKKSRTEPPASFKHHLRRLIEPIIDKGRRVHLYRGRSTVDSTDRVWNKVRDRDGFRYEVNLDNPAVEAVLTRLTAQDANSVVNLLQTVAETYPFHDVYQEMAGNNFPAQQSVDRRLITDRLREIRDAGLLSTDPVTVSNQLSGVEPFHGTDGLLALVEEVWRERNGAQ